MAQPFTTTSFYGRNVSLTTVIPGPVIAESDDDKTDDEEEPTLPEVSNDAQDEDYVPENVVIEDDAASDDSEDSVQEDEISRPTTSRGRPKGRSGASKKRETAYSWRKKELEVAEIQKEKAFTTPDEVGSALHYFKKVFDDETFEFIAEQTNLYSVQATGSSVNTNSREMQDFISILLYTGLVDMPSYTYYWAQHTRFPPIADLMPLKRFQKLRRYIHFNDNGKADESSDRYYKIRPVMETIRKNFMKLEEEVQFSIDEMMVPYKGTRAGNLRQYIKSKPHKWGFKLFARAGVSGIIYDFFPYAGSSTFDEDTFTEDEKALGQGGQVVAKLCKSISEPNNSQVCFDNFFTSLELLVYLKEHYQIYCTGTLRANRKRNLQLKNDKQLSTEGRGSFDYRTDSRAGITVIKWYDNKSVILASSFVGVQPLGTVKRYDKATKAKVDVPAPNIVKKYNHNMGGVDLADMLISLYRTPLKSKRWYLPLFGQLLDMSVVNAWLLYRRDTRLLGNGKPKPLCVFRSEIAFSLPRAGRSSPRGRPSSEEAPEPAKKIMRVVVPRPTTDVRYDNIDHWPIHADKGRCRLCPKGWSRMKCSKCQVVLCWTKERNCFLDFHKK